MFLTQGKSRRRPITPRQIRVVELRRMGYTQIEIAMLLGITQPAVCKHLRAAGRNRPHLTVCRNVRPRVMAFSQLSAGELRLDCI